MIRKYKKELIAAFAFTLLPVLVGLLLWEKLPQNLAIHYGFDGEADGFGSLAFVVFAVPLLMLATQWLCVLCTIRYGKNHEQNPKLFRLMLWIIPVTGNLVCSMIYALALGLEVNPLWLMQPMLGIMFIAIGNYLPKCRQNYTMGIKITWTLADEENWNATHRFGGKVWTVGGVVILLGTFLPLGWASGVMFLGIMALVVIPMIYSYRFYRRKKAAGTLPTVTRTPMTKQMKRLSTGAAVFVAAILIFVTVLLVTGDLDYQFGDTSLRVKASFYSDLVVSYNGIDTVEYRDGDPGGLRTFGFGSFRLQMGAFQNDEFGPYTRYTYWHPDACVIVRSGGRTLVLSGRTEEQTRTLYETLAEKAG